MNQLQITSNVKIISDNIDKLRLDEKINKGKKIAIWGMDVFSFTVKSLLGNQGIVVDYFVSDNLLKVTELRRKISGFANRYSNGSDCFVKPILLSEIDNVDLANIIILNASEINENERKYVNGKGFVDGINFFDISDSDDEFLDYVRDKQKIQLHEIQNLEKKILGYFDDFCRNHDLKYWVCGGTLLGTIRHKGFIPWDDDVDVFMPWKDYCRLIDEFESTDEYRIVSLDKKEFHECYADNWAKIVENTTIIRENSVLYKKIHPVWIDIFPIVGVPEDEKERLAFFNQVTEIGKRGTEAFYRNSGSILAKNSLYPEMVKLYKKYDFNCSNYVGVLGTQYKEKDCTPRSVYNRTLRMPFEDIEVNVPEGYKNYLDNLYGPDWMMIPDESKRKSHHELEAYWI